MTAKDYEVAIERWNDLIGEKIEHYQKRRRAIPCIEDQYARYGGYIDGLCLAMSLLSIEERRQRKNAALRAGESVPQTPGVG